MHATDDYTVRLDQFHGPLDLLLYLARKAEVELATLPIAEITDQYIEHLRGIDRIDIDLAGEFLVMAATLMELKSRLVSPGAAGDESDDAAGEPGEPAAGGSRGRSREPEDLRAALIGQLLAYKTYRDAADALERRAGEWSRRHAIAPAGTDREAIIEAVQRRNESVELEDIGLYDLMSAYQAVLERVNFDRLGSHHVTLDDDDTPIEEHAADLLDRLASLGAATPLREFFRGRSRGQVVGLFVATLELVRRRRLRIDPDETTGEPVLSLREEAETAEELLGDGD